ncbi:MAG TPA: sodium:proline symporter [Rhodocyclaceae bacterium]|nr:sodium:proline symporter [Rhodocyclaceae bacterium]
MPPPHDAAGSARRFLAAAAVGGIVAGIVSTLVQLILWLLFTDALPDILWRDARLTAAVVLGPGVLPPPATFDWLAMAVASFVHFGLSLAYGIAFCAVARRLRWRRPAVTGALLGLVLYAVNLYGFTWLFPWFAAARDWITLAAHAAFGASATATCRLMLRRWPGRNGRSAPMS